MKIIFRYVMQTIVFMLIHLLVVYFFYQQDIVLLHNFYTVIFLLNIPFFFLYVWIYKNFKDYLGYSFMALNGLKTILYIGLIIYFIKGLKYNEIFTFLNFMIIYFAFIVPEILFLVKLLNKK